MDWQLKLREKCDKYQIEAMVMDNQLVFVCPKIPDTKIQDEIRSICPSGTQYKFEEGPRVGTMLVIKQIFNQVQGHADMIIKDHDLTITAKGDDLCLAVDSPFTIILDKVLEADTFVESWKLIVNDQVVVKGDKTIAKIVAKQTRPQRENTFSNDDILNLQITLESCQDVNDFINSL